MIQIIGDIDEAAFAKFDVELSALEKAKVKRVSISLMSDGGTATVGLAFYDRIRISTIYIGITAYGEVGSAAALVFVAGDFRVMTKNSCLHVHEEQCGNLEGVSVTDASKTISRNRDVDDQYNRLMASRTSVTVTEWEVFNSNEEYLAPDKCRDLKICDIIMTEKGKKEKK